MVNPSSTHHYSCPECNEQFKNAYNVCPNCNYPIEGTDEEKMLFGRKQAKLKYEYSTAQDSIKQGMVILVVVSIYLIINAFLALSTNPMFTVIDLAIYLVFSGVYIGLAFFARRHPFICMSIGLGLLLLFYTIGAVTSPSAFQYLYTGIIWKIVLTSLLLVAAVRGYKAEKLIKEIANTNWLP